MELSNKIIACGTPSMYHLDLLHFFRTHLFKPDPKEEQ